MTIEYVNSYDINTPDELDEIFKEEKGVIINGRIYTSINSILEIDYLNHRYYSETTGHGDNDSDNEIKTLEFERIGKLAYSLRFPNQ